MNTPMHNIDGKADLFETREQLHLDIDANGKPTIWIKDDWFGGSRIVHMFALPLEVAEEMVDAMQRSRDGSRLTIDMRYWHVQ